MLMQAARANDHLSTEVTTLREEKLRLQVIVAEADKQLEMLRKDLDNVRRNQVNLMDKLKVCTAAKGLEVCRPEKALNILMWPSVKPIICFARPDHAMVICTIVRIACRNSWWHHPGVQHGNPCLTAGPCCLNGRQS